MSSYGLDGYGDGPYGGTLLAVAGRTQDAYDRLPEHYRDVDEGLDYPLLRYLSLLADQLAPLDELLERIDYDVDEGDTTSDLVDAQGANASWFPWLAQLLGVTLDGLTVAEQRARLADPAATWDHGSAAAIREAAARILTGTRTVTVTPHYQGDPFVIGVGTLNSETPLLDTFGELNAAAPRWADLHALGSFEAALADGITAAVEVERPAGHQIVRYSTGA